MPAPRPSSSPAPLAWGLGFLFALLALELAAVLHANGGMLVYTLDDPYIHLALAENLARGHYGVNPGEFSAPSSSIAWAVLLAPFALGPLAEWAPLLLNVLCAAGVTVAFAALLRRALGEASEGAREGGAPAWMHALLLCALILVSNLPALVFTGMEHVPQVLMAAWVALGLAIDAREGKMPRWLPWAVVLAPLARYELVTVSAGALLYLALRGRPGLAAGVGAATAALLGAFSFWLLHLGLEALPSSVLLKSGMSAGGAGGPMELGGLAASAARRLREASMHDRGAWLSLALLLAAARGLFPPVGDLARAARAKALAAAAVAAAGLHLLFGSYGSSNRYEVYILAFCLLLLTVLFGGPLARFLRGADGSRAGRLGVVVVVAGFVLVFGYRYLSATRAVPRASNAIYLQQYQMHRFVTGWYKRPVAVNDLGWTSFRNDLYVLDLWGLASLEALRRRRAGDPPEWMDDLARARGARLAMVYRFWFEAFPSTWIEIGELRDGRGPEVPGSRVTFFARDAEARAEAEALLRDFRRTLPAPATFVFTEEAEARATAGAPAGGKPTAP